MADVFLSYKREERAKIEALAAALKELDLDVWFDLDLVPGDAFARTINDELSKSRAVVVCWSKGAIDSDWVQAEAHKAHGRGVYVSARLEACEPPVPFNAFQDADLTTWSGAWEHEGLRALVTKVARLVKRPVHQTLLKLARAETKAIEAEVDDPEVPEDIDERPVAAPQTPDVIRSYILGHAERGSRTGSKDLAANLAQISFEEEILWDERTRWLVTNDPDTAPQSKRAEVLTSLREALRRASAGDTIALLPGTYRGRFNLEKNVRLVGFGSRDERPVLVGVDDVAIIDVQADARIENLILESRDTSYALKISSGAPLILRCLIDRQQLAPSDRACLHVSGSGSPTLVASTVWSRFCPAVYFANGASCSAIGSDVFANEADAVVIQARAKPSFSRCEIKAENGHAVVAHAQASGRFDSCSLRAIGATTIVNHDGAYSKFVGNSISVRRGSLIDLRAGSRPWFERNRVDPDPEAKALDSLKEAELKKVFKNPEILRREAPLPVVAASHHRARFAKNKLPDGSELTVH